MPVALKWELQRRARRKHLAGKARDAYVYGTLRATGWKPKRERQRIGEKTVKKFRKFFD